jgi:GNAT-family acetyltransferase (TIGR03103 family)
MTNKNIKPLNPLESPSLKNWGKPLDGEEHNIENKNVVLDCGWGRLIFAHTFNDNTDIANVLEKEEDGKRDLAIYLRDPQVVLAKAPQQLFLDPSHTYRLWLETDNNNNEHNFENSPFTITEISSKEEVEQVNSIYLNRKMVPLNKDLALDKTDALTFIVAKDKKTNEVIGTMMGVDHADAFNDPENGTSLWSLAVSSQTTHAGVGISIVQYFANYYKNKGRRFVDVSVLHDNKQAIALYEKLGFERVPAFCIKNKNAINENLFISPEYNKGFNPYAQIIIDEARKRGIEVETLDAKGGFFKLKYGARTIICRESLTELTSSIAMTRCAEKDITNKLLKNAGLSVPEQIVANSKTENQNFLEQYERIVVKPANGEQGAGITLPITNPADMEKAIKKAGGVSNKIILEQLVEGQDLRVIVIGYEVVAAAIRKPPEIIGNGETTIKELIKKLSRRRENATQGESTIPIDKETKRCVSAHGYSLDDVLEEGQVIKIRNTANLHTGGTIHDVTDSLSSEIAQASKMAAHAIDIPVVGLDFMVKDYKSSEYYIIEANERPGLANHEPQPTAKRFIDLLFPNSISHRISS